MAASDYNGVGSGLSTGVTAQQLARAHQEWEIQRQQDANGAMIGFTVFGAIAVLLMLSVVLHRRKIARATDAAIVSGLATGVRTVRAAASKRDAFIGRVLAKADEKTPQN